MVDDGVLGHVQRDMALLTALQSMDEANVAQVPVVENDTIVGVLARDQVLHWLCRKLQMKTS